MNLKIMSIAAALAVLPVAGGAAWAIDAASVPEPKQTKAKLYLGAEEVPGFIASKSGKVLFLDVRTSAEVQFVGNTPTMDANVPFKNGPVAKWDEKKGVLALEPNPDFVAQVEARLAAKSLTKADPVVVMCRSGDRSAEAANKLTEAGFTAAYSIVDGFEGDVAKEGPTAGLRTVNGWKNKSLPWGYKLDKAKMPLPAAN